jgi:PAS domain S-box-containing protein
VALPPDIGSIIGVFAIIVLQALLIAGLLFQRTKSARASRRLAESEERFAKAFKANPQPMALSTLDEGRYVDVNQSFVEMSGYSRDELIGRTSVDLSIFATQEERTKLFLRPLLETGTSRNFETSFRTRSGDFRQLLSSAELIDLGGRKCIVVASTDITERKQAEQQLTELTGRLLRTQDDERRHIARELHDGTAQNIGLIMLNLAQVQGTAGKLDKKNADRLCESLALGEQALREIRTLSYVLHPPLLDQAGLMTALKWYVKGFSDRSGVKVDLTETGSNGRMPPEVEYALFRVVQECLTNIRRHTNSETAEIALTRTSNEVVLTVKDYGKGHQVMAMPNGDGIESIGVGISGMRHRMKQLGGELLVDTDANGTRVTATVPVKAN